MGDPIGADAGHEGLDLRCRERLAVALPADDLLR